MESLLFPIIYCMKETFEFMHGITGNHGLAIISMSLAFNFITLPLYYAANQIKKNAANSFALMGNELSSIKKHYQGRERFFYEKAIYRRYGHTPYSQISASFGLLLQIPFFMAIYIYISGHTDLQGVSFGPITDLSLPDSIGLGTPILPILMFITNTISVFIHSNNANKREKNILLFTGLVFLLLLYREAAALLLFWTTSNIFSLGKTVTQGGIPKIMAYAKKPKPYLCFEKRIHAVQGYFYYPIFIGIFIATLLLFGVYQSDKYAYISLAYICMLLLSLLLGSLIIRRQVLTHAHIGFRCIIQTLLLMSLFFAVLDVGVTSELEKTVFRKPYYVTEKVLQILAYTIAIIIIAIPVSFIGKHLQNKPYTGIRFFTATTALLLVFTTSAIILYNATQDFTIASRAFVIQLFVSIAAVLVWMQCIYLISSKGLQSIFTLLIPIFTLFAAVYAFIFVGDFGVLNNFEFENAETLHAPIWLKIIEISTLCFAAFLVYYLLQKRSGLIFFMHVFLLCITSTYILLHLPDTSTPVTPTTLKKPHSINTEQKTTLAFSKEKNIVVFFLDAFSGVTLSDILAKDKNALHDYDGFTWYKNTLSTSLATWSSLAELIGGKQFSIENTLQNKSDFKEQLNKAYSSFTQQYVGNGWDVHFFNTQYSSNIDKKAHIAEFDYAKYYFDSYQPNTLNSLQNGTGLTMVYALSLFRIAPFVTKNWLYDNSDWLGMKKRSQTIHRVQLKGKHWGLLQALEHHSTFDNKKPVIKYLQLEAPHSPNLIGADGKIHTKKVPLHDESLALLHQIGNIIKKLKEQGVYENTKIIMVSDHGNWRLKSGREYPDFSSNFNEVIPQGYWKKITPGRVHVLLMVKEIGADGPLQISNKFMTNADTAAIACAELKENCWLDTANPVQNNAKRTLRLISAAGTEIPTYESVDIRDVYDVKDNIFDPYNWKRVNSLVTQ